MDRTEFELNKEIYKSGIRGTYLIIPVLLKEGCAFNPDGLIEQELSNSELDDKSKLIEKRCKDGYVKKYLLSDKQNPFSLNLPNENVTLRDFQLFLFDNGIGFVTMLALCENKDIGNIYALVNTGYVGTDDENSDSYSLIYDKISGIISKNNLKIYLDKDSIDLLLNESYIFNFALTTKRFENLDTLKILSMNVHKQIEMESDFEDASEADINYTSGARDVKNKTYRWGSCISSLDISFVYACKDIPKDEEELISVVKDVTECDLFLTILAMIQKYTCMRLNEAIHESLYVSMRGEHKKATSKSVIQNLKRQALEFRAFGTLAPSQISRWNNVCETYRYLLEAQGVEEALEEIEQKIELINSDQQQKVEKRQNIVSAIIAIFGLSSIIASVMQVVEYIATGSSNMLISFAISSVIILLVLIYWLTSYFKEK